MFLLWHVVFRPIFRVFTQFFGLSQESPEINHTHNTVSGVKTQGDGEKQGAFRKISDMRKDKYNNSRNFRIHNYE